MSFVKGFIVGLGVSAAVLPGGCASTVPGQPSAASVASSAAAAGLAAYVTAMSEPGMTRDRAFRLATQAAVAEASTVVPLAVAEEYRPFIAAALAALALQLDSAKVSGDEYPSSDSVREAIEIGIARAGGVK